MRARVLRHHFAGWADPSEVFIRLYGDAPECFWLDSGSDARSGMSYMGAGSRRATARAADDFVELDGRPVPGTVFDLLRAECAAGTLEPSEGFQLGWVGWLGYELRHQTAGTGATRGDAAPRASRYPDAALIFADRVIAFDHAARSIALAALVVDDEHAAIAWRDAVIEALAAASAAPGRRPASRPSAGPAEPAAPAGARWHDAGEEYLGMVAACQAAIAAGEAYQLCLTTEVEVPVHPDPVALYLALRSSSPSHHGGLVRSGGVSLLSSSPERFLSATADGVVRTQPIKGTRPRGATAELDAALAAELFRSEKERAENLMIVDLMRNDLARVCAPGSVEVSDLFEVQSYAQVHQLVSTVQGRLAEGMTGIDAVMACFPAGSMTGAPKLRAMELLDAIERRPRGVYSGAFGYFGLDGAIDLAMVIRSIVLDAGGAVIGTGGGITALSVAADELAEARLKAAAPLAALLAAGGLPGAPRAAG